MTPRKCALLEAVERSPALSIYQLAKVTGRNYRRVYDHVQELAAAGLLTVRPEVRNGRRVSMVEGVVHQRLRHLDELFAFKGEIDAAQ